MPGIAAARLLEAWEQGQTQHPLHRSLTLLRICETKQTIDDLASLPIGERDRRLIAVRQRLFGSRFDAVAECPRCQEKLELTFTADQLPVGAAAPALSEVAADGRAIPVRLPNTLDLLEAALERPERRVPALLERCAGGDLSPCAAEAVQERMAEMDPMARIQIQLGCPACGHGWSEVFDIASYLWTEVSDRALRLLRETHTLARAYGWSEADILPMTPQRRRVYLDLIMGG
jgi:hypothetical protein